MPPFFEDASSSEDFGSNGMNLEHKHTYQELVQIIEKLNAKIIDLEDRLAKAEARADKAEARADKAEARADEAEARAKKAEERADKAEAMVAEL